MKAERIYFFFADVTTDYNRGAVKKLLKAK